MTGNAFRGRKSFAPFTLVLFAGLCFFLMGCSETRSVTENVKSTVVNTLTPDAALAKRVLVLPLVDLAGVGADKAAEIDAAFFDRLRAKESSHYTLHKAPPGLKAESAVRAPEFCYGTRPEVVAWAEKHGMHALVHGVLNPIETKTEKKGIWPFKGVARIYEVSMIFNVVDAASGTLYLNHIESKQMTRSVEDFEYADDEQILTEVLDDALPGILKKQASAVSEELSEEPWSGKILSVDEGQVLIDAGADVGVRPGQLFHVYAAGESIRCQTGREFELLGRKVGEVKASSVMENRTIAVAESGGPFVPGQVIRFKR
jgi:hypothetical protein